MSKYCVVHKLGEFKILYTDSDTAALWRQDGWEVRAYSSNEEAQKEMESWRTTPALVPLQPMPRVI